MIDVVKAGMGSGVYDSFSELNNIYDENLIMTDIMSTTPTSSPKGVYSDAKRQLSLAYNTTFAFRFSLGQLVI